MFSNGNNELIKLELSKNNSVTEYELKVNNAKIYMNMESQNKCAKEKHVLTVSGDFLMHY